MTTLALRIAVVTRGTTVWLHARETDRPIDPRRTNATPRTPILWTGPRSQTDACPDPAQSRPRDGRARLYRRGNRRGAGCWRGHGMAGARRGDVGGGRGAE